MPNPPFSYVGLILPGIDLSRKERSNFVELPGHGKKVVVMLVLCPSFRYASGPITEIELFVNSFQFGDSRKPQRYEDGQQSGPP